MSVTVDWEDAVSTVDRKLPPVLREIPIEGLSTTVNAERVLACSSHSSLQDERAEIHLRVTGSESQA